jgi:hypothetical protein
MLEETKIVPKIEPPNNDSIDNAADKESAVLASGDDLEKITRYNQLQRSDNLNYHLHLASKLAIWGLVIALGAFGFCFIWHLVTPWKFLNPEQIDDIRNILFSGLLTAVLSKYYKQYL